MPIGTHLNVNVLGFDDEGRGRGVLEDGQEAPIDIAVRGAFPGDVVSCTVERVFKERRLVQARLRQLLVRGRARGERECLHRGPCAGCPLEGAWPSFAIAVKMGRLQQALSDADLDLPVENIVLGPDGLYGYRQKVKWAVGGYAGHLVLGLYAPRSHRVIDATLCPYTNPRIIAAAEHLTEVLNAMNIPSATADPDGLKAIVLRAFSEGVSGIVVTGSPLSAARWALLSKLVDNRVLKGIGERVDSSSGNSVVGGELERTFGTLELTPLTGGAPESPDTFCQPCPVLAAELYERTASFLAEENKEGDWYLDAYAGSGGFAHALVRKGATHVCAVERTRSILSGATDSSVEWIQSSVEEAGEMLLGRSAPSGIVADPPRKGLGQDARLLARLGARRMVLVSCAPESMARDLKVLLEENYRVLKIVPYDFFAGTPQIEAAVFLERIT
jgi:23S rRNA (uracil1939-C5)-methyltransferase